MDENKKHIAALEAKVDAVRSLISWTASVAAATVAAYFTVRSLNVADAIVAWFTVLLLALWLTRSWRGED